MHLPVPRRALKRLLSGAALLTATLGVAWACSDITAPAATRAPNPAGPQLSLASVARSGRAAQLRSLLAPDRCANVWGASRSLGAELALWSCVGAVNEEFTWMPNGEIRVYPGENLCLTSDQGFAASGHAVVLWTCNAGPAQLWEPTEDGKGIRQTGTNFCITTWGGSSELGTRLIDYPCQGAPSQQWTAVLLTADAIVSLADAYGDGHAVALRSTFEADRCVDVVGYNTDPGATVAVWTCNGSANQQWRWGTDGTLRTYFSGVERCLDAWGASGRDGDRVDAYTCVGGAWNQRWEPSPDGTRIRLQGTTKCVNIAGASRDVGAPLQLWECGGYANQEWEARTPGRATCGVSMTVIATETDSLMTPYGIQPEADTTAVCETWVGADYSLNYQATGSSEWAVPELADDLRTATYDAGAIAGYTASGVPIEAPSPVGPTVFDFVNADSAARAASYDDPYYGVRALDPATTGCADPKQVICESGAAFSRSSLGTAATTGGGASADTGKREDKFKRHGLKRRGVRALVDDTDEIARSPEGHRRFRKIAKDEERILTLDAQTELLIREETTSRGRSVKAAHTWKKMKHGKIAAHVRTRTDVEETEVIGGKEYRSRATLEFRDVRLH